MEETTTTAITTAPAVVGETLNVHALNQFVFLATTLLCLLVVWWVAKKAYQLLNMFF